MKTKKLNNVWQWLAVFVATITAAEILSTAASRSRSQSQPQLQADLQLQSNAPIQTSIGEDPQAIKTWDAKSVAKRNLTDAQLLQDAADAPRPLASATPRLAFLFLVRGDIPHEPLWTRFFHGHEDQYSLYVHATPGHTYRNGSLFEGLEIASKPSQRFSLGLVDAIRRLLSYALLDNRYNNAWFITVCESTIPIRAFSFAYHYLMASKVSFVESFFPVQLYHCWETLPDFPRSELRKGEMWMALTREHARVVVSDSEIYSAFVARCNFYCTWDEQYVQTLLHLRDAGGIAERTVMYANWTTPHENSPHALSGEKSVIKEVQSRMRDVDGERHDTAFSNTTIACVHDGVAPSPCFLFARKFASSETEALLSLNPQDLGY